MAIRLGDIVPNFTADSTQGTVDFHQAIDQSWAILFSHPKDYTPVCTTELGSVARFRHQQLLVPFNPRGLSNGPSTVSPDPKKDRPAGRMGLKGGRLIDGSFF